MGPLGRLVDGQEEAVGEINLEVWDATGNKRLKVLLPDDVVVERILMVLADKLHLPRYAPNWGLKMQAMSLPQWVACRRRRTWCCCLMPLPLSLPKIPMPGSCWQVMGRNDRPCRTKSRSWGCRARSASLATVLTWNRCTR